MIVYSIDFDGTIVENMFPAIGPIKPEARDFINMIKSKGDKWILNTMREGQLLKDAVDLLEQNDLYPDAINDNLKEMQAIYHNNPRKIFANVYIDDHNAGGLQFKEPLDYQKPKR